MMAGGGREQNKKEKKNRAVDSWFSIITSCAFSLKKKGKREGGDKCVELVQGGSQRCRCWPDERNQIWSPRPKPVIFSQVLWEGPEPWHSSNSGVFDFAFVSPGNSCSAKFPRRRKAPPPTPTSPQITPNLNYIYSNIHCWCCISTSILYCINHAVMYNI